MSFQRATILLMLVALVSKCLGFLREVFLAYFYGASAVSDAYLIALTIPGVIFSFIGAALTIGYVPIFSVIRERGGDFNRFTNNLINIIFIISTFLIVLTCIYTDFIVEFFAPGFNGETSSLAVLFTRIFVLGIYASALIHIYTGLLQVNNSFVAASFAGVPFNFVILLSIYLSAKFGTTYLIVGALVAKLIELLFFAPYLMRLGYRYAPVLDFRDKDVRSLFFLATPLILSVSVNQINILVDRSLASSIAVGGISALTYAHHLNQFVLGVFVISIATVVFPAFSKAFVAGEVEDLNKRLSDSISLVSFLVIPSSIFFMVFANPIVSVVYGRGEFDDEALKMTSSSLFYFSVGMIGFAYREILSRLFYAMHDSKTAVINAVIGVLINIVLSLILSRYMGVAGLAFATSISAIITSLLLFFSLSKIIKSWGASAAMIDFCKLLIAALVATIIAWWFSSIYFVESSFSELIVSFFVISFIYILLAWFFKISILLSFARAFSAKFFGR